MCPKSPIDTEIEIIQDSSLTRLSSELQIQLKEKGKTCPVRRRHLAGFWLPCMSTGAGVVAVGKAQLERCELFSGGKVRTRPQKTASQIALMNCPEGGQ